jgi:hypothetical protein
MEGGKPERRQGAGGGTRGKEVKREWKQGNTMTAESSPWRGQHRRSWPGRHIEDEEHGAVMRLGSEGRIWRWRGSMVKDSAAAWQRIIRRRHNNGMGGDGSLEKGRARGK